jgi:hypothetical protein
VSRAARLSDVIPSLPQGADHRNSDGSVWEAYCREQLVTSLVNLGRKSHRDSRHPELLSGAFRALLNHAKTEASAASHDVLIVAQSLA